MAEAEYRNRFFKVASEMIRTYDTIGPNELARRVGITPQASYVAQLAYRGVVAALRCHNLLPNDGPKAINGKATEIEPGTEFLTLEEAQARFKDGPVLLTGPLSKRPRF